MNHDIVLEVLGACDKRREERRAFMKNAGLAVAGATVLAACSNADTVTDAVAHTRPHVQRSGCAQLRAQPRISRSAILFLRSQRHLDPDQPALRHGYARRAERRASGDVHRSGRRPLCPRDRRGRAGARRFPAQRAGQLCGGPAGARPVCGRERRLLHCGARRGADRRGAGIRSLCERPELPARGLHLRGCRCHRL